MRWVLRSARMAVILVVLSLGALTWFVLGVGLPEFVKTRWVAQMQSAGWNVDFSRMHLRGWHTVVVDDLQVQRTNAYNTPSLFVEQARCRLQYDFRGWKDLGVRLESIQLEDGRLLVPYATSNQNSRLIALNHVEGDLLLLPNDDWDLRGLRAQCFGLQVDVRGTLQHASLLRDWKLPSSGRKGPRKPANWARLFELIQQLQFSSQPALSVRFQADGRDLHSLEAAITLKAPDIRSPWISATNLDLSGTILRAESTNALFRTKLQLSADALNTSQANVRNAHMTLEMEPGTNGFPCSETRVSLDLGQTIHASNVVNHLAGTMTFDPVDRSTFLSFQLQTPQFQWGQSHAAQVQARLILPQLVQWKAANSTNFWFERLRDVPGEVTLLFTNVEAQRIQAERLKVEADWHWPKLQVKSVGKLYQGQLAATAELNATNREVSFGGESDINLARIVPWLSTNVQRALTHYSGPLSPRLEWKGQAILPEWTNRAPDWKGEVLPSLSLAGQAETGAGAYRSNAWLKVQSSFALTNLVWYLPRLILTRPEGELEVQFQTDLRSTDYHWLVLSHIDPKAAKSFFQKANEQKAFDMVAFSTPPRIQTEVRGTWRQPQRLQVTAETSITNFIFRSEPIRFLHTRLEYSNQVLRLIAPRVTRPEGVAVASLAEIDFSRDMLYLTNAESTVDPMAIARMVGPHVVRVLSPYCFSNPPQGRVNGYIDLKRRSARNNARFQLEGGPFHWHKFDLQRVSGQLEWVGDGMALKNVQGDFRRGRLDGEAQLDFTPKVGDDFSFKATIVDADFHELLMPWSSPSNRLAGLFNGEVTITSGNTKSPQSCQGFGWASLTDGMIWDLPMFGVFSPVLNAFIPGLGNSQARKASATFLITNSIVSTKDMEVHATGMRMQLQGTVDLNGQIEARVEAELLRNVPGIGLVVSKVFWPVTKLFEYKLTGQLEKPRAEPLYVLPKIIMAPFHPIRSLKELLGEEPPISAPVKQP